MSSPETQRWVAVFDTHGDEIDESAERSFKSFVGWWKPHFRIHGGDGFDFRWLRRSCSTEEEAQDVRPDFDAGLDFLKWYQPDVFLWGNHDDRLARMAEANRGADRNLAAEWIRTINQTLDGAKQLPYCRRNGVFKYGDTSFIHGYSHGTDAVRSAARAYGTVVMGHTHAIDSVRLPCLEDVCGYTAGCLCNLNMDYCRPNIGTLRQAHGWAYGIRRRNKVIVWQAKKLGDVWYFPSEYKTIKA
jgi:hypothetical protein